MRNFKVIHTVHELQEWREAQTGTVAFVPTMGALHEGHATLLRKARPQAEISVLSIFVNPTQFGPKEDLSRYPRTWESDLKIAEQEGVDLIFAPSPDEIYPEGFSTFVDELTLSQPLCGQYRPGHFRGVTTVVLKLFNLVRPNVALFGLKDAQQFCVIKKMVRDLNLTLEVQGVPTIREPDGLALSSRNRYLAPMEREQAPIFYKVLKQVAAQIRTLDSAVDIAPVLDTAQKELVAKGFQVQYLECLSFPDLAKIKNPKDHDQGILVAGAVYLGKTRLIDNIVF